MGRKKLEYSACKTEAASLHGRLLTGKGRRKKRGKETPNSARPIKLIFCTPKRNHSDWHFEVVASETGSKLH